MNERDREVVEAMRDWIFECTWGDLEEDERDELTDVQVVRGVARHYSGGVAQFMADSLFT